MFGTDRREVQDYIQFQGVWFPKVVVLTTYEGTKNTYTLESVGKTASEVLIDLPIGTRVRDWRHLGREALKQALEFLDPDMKRMRCAPICLTNGVLSCGRIFSAKCRRNKMPRITSVVSIARRSA